MQPPITIAPCRWNGVYCITLPCRIFLSSFTRRVTLEMIRRDDTDDRPNNFNWPVISFSSFASHKTTGSSCFNVNPLDVFGQCKHVRPESHISRFLSSRDPRLSLFLFTVQFGENPLRENWEAFIFGDISKFVLIEYFEIYQSRYNRQPNKLYNNIIFRVENYSTVVTRTYKICDI